MPTFRDQATAYESMMEARRSRQDEAMDDARDEEGMEEAEPDYEAFYEAAKDRKLRHPREF